MESADKTQHHPRHLLLFEENPGLERILSLLLKRTGYQVSLGRSSAETESPGRPFSALIADLSSTSETEATLLSRIGKVAPGLPTVLIVPYGRELPRELLPPHCSLLSSPLVGEELLHCLDRLFGKPAGVAKDIRHKS